MLFLTGWNTDQDESIKNYNDWAHVLMKANQSLPEAKRIRPVMIGVSWPSKWHFPAGNPISFIDKANDADELGITWINQIVNKVMTRVKNEFGVNLVVVGHSFGARMGSMALYSAPLVESNTELPSPPHVDLFVGLEAAFSINRFIEGKEKEGAPYSTLPRPAKFLFTSSRFDKAVSTPFWNAGFISAESVREKLKKQPWNKIYEDLAMAQSGRWEIAPSTDTTKVAIFNADLVIKDTPAGSKSGAHSDVYKPEIGEFLMQSISEFSPIK